MASRLSQESAVGGKDFSSKDSHHGKFQLEVDIPERVEGEDNATDRQIQFIAALLREIRATDYPEQGLEELGKWQASSLISQLMDFKEQIAGNKPIDADRISGLDDGSILNANIGKPLLIGFILLLVVMWAI